jgi:hypothetical protein
MDFAKSYATSEEPEIPQNTSADANSVCENRANSVGGEEEENQGGPEISRGQSLEPHVGLGAQISGGFAKRDQELLPAGSGTIPVNNRGANNGNGMPPGLGSVVRGNSGDGLGGVGGVSPEMAINREHASNGLLLDPHISSISDDHVTMETSLSIEATTLQTKFGLDLSNKLGAAKQQHAGGGGSGGRNRSLRRSQTFPKGQDEEEDFLIVYGGHAPSEYAGHSNSYTATWDRKFFVIKGGNEEKVHPIFVEEPEGDDVAKHFHVIFFEDFNNQIRENRAVKLGTSVAAAESLYAGSKGYVEWLEDPQTGKLSFSLYVNKCVMKLLGLTCKVMQQTRDAGGFIAPVIPVRGRVFGEVVTELVGGYTGRVLDWNEQVDLSVEFEQDTSYQNRMGAEKIVMELEAKSHDGAKVDLYLIDLTNAETSGTGEVGDRDIVTPAPVMSTPIKGNLNQVRKSPLLTRSRCQHMSLGQLVANKFVNPPETPKETSVPVAPSPTTAAPVSPAPTPAPTNATRSNGNVNISTLGDVAKCKPTLQSSTVVDNVSSNAVNGAANMLLAHTDCEESPWFIVDLLFPRAVSSVLIFNRRDCCAERLDGVVIELLDELGDTLAFVQHDPAAEGHIESEWRADFDNQSARKVRVSVQREAGTCEFLNLASVQVFSPCTDQDSCNEGPGCSYGDVALCKLAEQSSTFVTPNQEGEVATLAVDGKPTLSHTECENNPYWVVHLSKPRKVTAVAVQNREGK